MPRPDRRRIAHADETPPSGLVAVEERLGELEEEVERQGVRIDGLTSAVGSQGETLSGILVGIREIADRGARRESAEAAAAEERAKFAAAWWRRLGSPQGTILILAVLAALGRAIGLPMPAVSFDEPGSAMDERDQQPQPHSLPQEPLPPIGE